MDEIRYKPIGIIHSEFKKKDGIPIQPTGASKIRGKVEVFPDYVLGLRDLEGFSHIYLIYHFHLSESYSLFTKPFMDDKKHGVFATHAPRRPNAIGMSVVRLVSIKDNILQIENIDIIDGTPLLDIKPYVPSFIKKGNVSIGWLSKKPYQVYKHRSDERFRLMDEKDEV
ncbi:MAG: tRNA (N6-threonylcarbamoyladenosine(37)-N6)-methyltransferase TrmO [Campylobacterota bacterium]|nr:tRNA (N6-threonylcarbamoyladenosine(37)-N6)-methyltransferase TrmO [Campylobacterota bacterium]